MALLQDLTAPLEAMAVVHRSPCGDGDLVFRRWGADDRRPVILAHGGSGSWTHWIRNIPALIPHYDVWAVDLPGLGDSAMPPKPWTPKSCGGVLADGIRRLIPAERKPHLVTFSFGGHVGMFAAMALEDHLASLVLSGCSALGLHPDLELFPKERNTMTAAERAHVHRRVLEILMFAEPSRIDDEAIALQAGNIEKARFRSREFAFTAEIKDRLHEVRVPVRAIWGERDVLAKPTLDHLLGVLRAAQPGLVARIVPHAGHWSMYENARAFNEALLDVLALG